MSTQLLGRRPPLRLQTDVTGFFHRVYVCMAFGLAVSAVVALWTSHSQPLLLTLVHHPTISIAVVLVQLLLVIMLSSRTHRLSIPLAGALFLFCAGLQGLIATAIFPIFNTSFVAVTFLIISGTFAITGVVGYFTKRNVSGLDGLCLMGLFGLVISLLVNLFVRSPLLDWVLSMVGVLITVGLTAYAVQRIKNGERSGHSAVAAALALYLDFLILFLRLLHFIGRRKPRNRVYAS